MVIPRLSGSSFLTACQHQPKEIGLTAVSSAYQKQHAQHQNDPHFAEQNVEAAADLIKEVAKLRFFRAGEQLAQHLTPECRARMIEANQKQSGTDYGMSRLGTLQTCEVLSLSDNDPLVQIDCAYGDTPTSYILALRLASADETWLVDQMLMSDNPPKPRGRLKVLISLFNLSEAILAHDYTRLAYLYQVPWDPEGLLFWSTVEIADSEIITQKIQTDQACYQLKITVEDPACHSCQKEPPTSGCGAVGLARRRNSKSRLDDRRSDESAATSILVAGISHTSFDSSSYSSLAFNIGIPKTN
ncbi:MAG: hypothetical protein ACLSA6_12300 [Holdemania massiliensis]